MDPLFRPFEDEFLAFDLFPLRKRNSFRVYLFGLLIVEQKVDLETELCIQWRYVGFHSEVADVVELDLLLVVPQ